jgi:hypothetical protein
VLSVPKRAMSGAQVGVFDMQAFDPFGLKRTEAFT